MSERPLTCRRLAERLRAFGAQEEPGRGRGSHRMWMRCLPDGTTARSPVPFHSSGTDIPRGTIRSIRVLLRLSLRDGVPDAEFYGD